MEILNIRNKAGPRTEPWGNLNVISRGSGISFEICTACVLLHMYEFIHFPIELK